MAITYKRFPAEKNHNYDFKKNSKVADSINLYTALNRMNGNRGIQLSQGYAMLRQLSYDSQRELAEGNTVFASELFE